MICAAKCKWRKGDKCYTESFLPHIGKLVSCVDGKVDFSDENGADFPRENVICERTDCVEYFQTKKQKLEQGDQYNVGFCLRDNLMLYFNEIYKELVCNCYLKRKKK